MRLFIAVNLSENAKDWLYKKISLLRENSDKGSFTKRENLHLTLVFIGEVPFEKIALIKGAMDSVKAGGFELKMAGLGRFRRNDGDIVWTGAEKGGVLFSVYEQLVESLIKSGFSIEKRRFTPHLTLGRRVVLKKGPDKICDGSEFIERVDKISLMLSERVESGMRYTEVYEKRLTEG